MPGRYSPSAATRRPPLARRSPSLGSRERCWPSHCWPRRSRRPRRSRARGLRRRSTAGPIRPARSPPRAPSRAAFALLGSRKVARPTRIAGPQRSRLRAAHGAAAGRLFAQRGHPIEGSCHGLRSPSLVTARLLAPLTSQASRPRAPRGARRAPRGPGCAPGFNDRGMRERLFAQRRAACISRHWSLQAAPRSLVEQRRGTPWSTWRSLNEQLQLRRRCVQ